MSKVKGCKTISTKLDVPVDAVANIRTFKVHSIVGDFPGCGSKRKKLPQIQQKYSAYGRQRVKENFQRGTN